MAVAAVASNFGLQPLAVCSDPLQNYALHLPALQAARRGAIASGGLKLWTPALGALQWPSLRFRS